MHNDLPHRYIFVFWQSLQDTSLPLAELQAVIHHLYPDLVVELAHLDTLLGESFHGAVPGRYAALAPLRQSALVASTKTLDITRIVARCGYTHSGGPLVLASQWRKVDSSIIRKHCRSYLAHTECTGAVLRWFRKSQEKEAPKHIQDLLIDDSRYHLGDLPFNPEANKISEALKGPSNEGNPLLYAYRDQAKSSSETRVLYLDYPERELEDFLIIYRTDAKKENPIHDLDQDEECKPFWAGIFNTPHRLINALLNLADVGEDKEVVDPFSYSGTVAIETASLGGIAQSFDISEVQGAQDNFDFLCTEEGKNDLLRVRDILADEHKNTTLRLLAKSHSRVNALQMPDVDANDRIEQLMQDPEHKSLLNSRAGRIAYYLLRRHNMERLRGVKGDDTIGADATKYAKEQLLKLETALDRIATLQKYRRKDDRLCVVPGECITEKYFRDSTHKSTRVFPSYTVKKPARRGGFLFIKHDITKEPLPIPDASVDAVVTDPPYGYGDLLDRDELYQVYIAFFDQALRILKSGGSLVFCALDKVRTGRSTNNLFTTEEVIRMLHDASCKHRVDFAFPSIDPVAQQARGLYYWKSTRALNRSIFAARIYRR